MLKDHRVFNLVSGDGEKVEIEVNWSNHKDVKDCQRLRFKFGDKELDFGRDEIVSILMLAGRSEDQKKLIPMKMTNIRKLERLLTFEWVASKSYQKGDKITVKAPWIDEVPNVEEVFSGNVTAKKKNPFKFFMK